MSENIRKALELRLAAMSPALATAWENVSYVPVQGTPYQRVTLLPAAPDNSVLGCAYRREVGILQVSLFYPINTGSIAAQARAEAVRSHFPRGLTLSNGGTNVLVTHTPSKAVAMQEGDRYVVPVSIRYQAEIFG